MVLLFSWQQFVMEEISRLSIFAKEAGLPFYLSREEAIS